MKVAQFVDKGTWYFSKYDWRNIERMQAIYWVDTKVLEVFELKSLPKVIKYLRKEGINEVTLTFE